MGEITQEDSESQSHSEFLNHTMTAVSNWRGVMDWKVLEKRQTQDDRKAYSFVKLMRYSRLSRRELSVFLSWPLWPLIFAMHAILIV